MTYTETAAPLQKVQTSESLKKPNMTTTTKPQKTKDTPQLPPQALC